MKERTWYKVFEVERGHSRRWSRHVTHTQVQSKKANLSHKKGGCRDVIRSVQECPLLYLPMNKRQILFVNVKFGSYFEIN